MWFNLMTIIPDGEVASPLPDRNRCLPDITDQLNDQWAAILSFPSCVSLTLNNRHRCLKQWSWNPSLSSCFCLWRDQPTFPPLSASFPYWPTWVIGFPLILSQQNQAHNGENDQGDVGHSFCVNVNVGGDRVTSGKRFDWRSCCQCQSVS